MEQGDPFPGTGLDKATVGRSKRRRGDVGRRHVVTPKGEVLGEHTDRAARFERVPVGRVGQQGKCDRILAPLVPPRLQLPRVRSFGVLVVEVRVGQSSGQRKTTSPTASRRRSTNGGNGGASGVPDGSNWLRKHCTATLLRSIAARLNRTAYACSHGTAESSGSAQCHIHTGYSINTAPVRGVAAAAARPTASWSGWPSPRQVAAHHVPGGRVARISVSRSASRSS